MFRFNADFNAPLYRVKINAIQLKETQEENKKTNDQVLQDRQYQARKPDLAPARPCSGPGGDGSIAAHADLAPASPDLAPHRSGPSSST